MKITILAVGSQGDVQPYAALGGGLARAGHAVTLASHETFRDLAKRCGIGFSLIAGNPMDIVQGPEGQAWLSSSSNYLKFIGSVRKLALGLLGQILDGALAASQGSDALIFSLPLSICGYTVAEVLKIPGIPAALYPLHRAWEFPSIMMPRLRLGHLGNWLSATVVQQIFWQFSRSLLRGRRKELGVGKMSFFPPMEKQHKEGLPFLYGYSPSVIPRPAGWPETRATCGYWFLEDTSPWQPDARLATFLEAGPPPVYVGFGSMASADSQIMTRVILDGIQRAGQRVLLSGGWGGFHVEDLPESVMPIGFVPHDWLFPRVALAIHHGGAGTAAAVFKAGVPQMIIPFFADQFFWGKRVSDLGLGAPPLNRKKLGAELVEKSVRSVMESPGMAARAREVAKAIRAEDGIAAAVRVVEGYFRST